MPRGTHHDPPLVQTLKYLSKQTAIHGKMFLFWPGNKAMLVCVGHNDVRQILTDTSSFVKGDDYTMKVRAATDDR